MGRLIEILDLNGGYAQTLDRDIAMTNNYIGDMPIYPNRITNLVKTLIGRPLLKPFIIIYYGTPDERLAEIFGYKMYPKTCEYVKESS